MSLWSVRKIDRSRDALGLGLWAGLVIICSHWLWDYGLYVPELASVFFVLLAGMLARTSKKEEPKASALVCILAGLLLAALWFVSIWIFAEQRAMKHAEEYFQKGDLTQAKADAEKAVKMVPADDYPEIILAWVAARTGEKPQTVESYFQRAIQLNPRFAFWRKDFGDYYVNIDKIKLAEDEYLKALSLYPNNPDFMAMLAKVRRYQGDLKGAQEMTDKAMAVSGNHQNVLWEMFYIQSDQGNHQRARNTLQQLVWAYQDQSAKMLLQRMRAEKNK